MRRETILVAVLTLLVMSPGLVAAATIYGESSGTIHLDAPNGPAVDALQSTEFTADVPITDDTIDFGHTQITGAGDATLAVDGLQAEFLTVSDLDTGTGSVTISSDQHQTVTLTGSASAVEYTDVTLDDGARDLSVTSPSGLSVTVNGLAADYVELVDANGVVVAAGPVNGGQATFDIQSGGDYRVQSVDLSTIFADPQPADGATVDATQNVSLAVDIDAPGTDTYDVTFVDASDGSQIGTDTVSGSGTATTTWTSPALGTNEWYVEIASGATEYQSQTYSFSTPSQLRIYNELQPDTLVDTANLTLTVRFVREGEDRVIQREPTDGTVALSELPAETFVVEVNDESDTYYNRRIVVESIYEQQEIYLLPQSVSPDEITFELNDQTGRFDQGDTKLQVQKPLTKNGETRFRTVSGDYFSPSGAFTTRLETETRYRLVVSNAEGETRILGDYRTAGNAFEPLPIGEVQITADAEQSWAATASTREAPDGAAHDTEIKVNYYDPERSTDNVSIAVMANGTEVAAITERGEFGLLSATLRINDSEFDPDQQSGIVNITAERGSETVSTTEEVGSLPTLFVPSKSMLLLSWVLLLGMIGLLVIVSPVAAALGGTALGGLMTAVGLLHIPWPAVALAGSIALAYSLGVD